MILLYDTSGKDLHCALFDPLSGKIERAFNYIASPSERGVHDSMLASTINEMITAQAITPKDISKVGLIIGPGSFTGLRIGLAFAKGMAFGNNCEIVPVLAHQWLAASAKQQYPDKQFDVVATAGYEPTSLYIADYNTPEIISLQPKSDIASQKKTIAIFEGSITDGIGEATPVTIDLEVLGKLAINTEAKELSSLEPFYGTDFKPHPGAKK